MRACVPAVLTVALPMALLGCVGLRTPARDATLGVLDAIQNPPSSDRLVIDLRTLLQRYVERALAAGPPANFGDLAANVTARVLREAGTFAPEAQAFVRSAVEEALRAGFAVTAEEVPRLTPELAAATRALTSAAARGVADQAPLLSQEIALAAQRSANAAVRGAASGASDALEAQVRHGEGMSPVVVALAQAAELFAAALVRGAAAGLHAEVGTCVGAEGGACSLNDLARRAGSAATQGALDTAEPRALPWLIGGAMGLGAVLLGCAALVARAIAKRPVSL
jgi:hypothetical protein